MKSSNQELIKEAIKRGYSKGVAIQYVPWITDYIEGNYIEVSANGDVVAYAKPQEERNSFDDNTFDTLYNSEKKQWVKIVSEIDKPA